MISFFTHQLTQTNKYLQPNRSFSSQLSSVRYAKSLKTNDLQDLANGKIQALRIPNFCSQPVVKQVLQNLNQRKIVDYTNAEGVGKFQDVGMAYFEIESKEDKEKYYQTRLDSIQTLRKAFDPYLSPIDKVRLILDEQWPLGASLMNLGQGPMFTGLVRAIKGEILPHEDKLERDDPQGIKNIHYVSQLAFNCYLAVPKTGGELQLWDLSLSDEEYNHLRGESYGIHRSKLPDPALVLKPESGEFIAFNGRNLHAVSPSLQDKTVRVSVSGFLLYQGEKKALHVWS